MSGQIIQIRSIALAVPLLMWGVGIGVPTNPAHADDCFTAPHSAAPKGSHWYYHTDRAKRRKCWFLGPTGLSRQQTAAKVTSAATKDAHAIAVEKPATAPAGALMSTSAGGSTPPLAPLKAQPAPMSSATTYEPVQQYVQEGRTAPSIPKAPTPPASASLKTSAQVAEAAPAATIVWPDPPAVATVKAQKSNLVLTDARADSVLRTVDVRAPDDSEGAARRAGSTTQALSSPAATFVEILLVVALGLCVAGLLYRVVMKITARRGRRIVNHHSKSDWIDSQREWRDDWQQHGSVYEGERGIDYLQPSLVPAAGDYSARHPLRADECENNARGKGSASQFADKVSGRENTLAQLIRDLDEMLQSRKGA